MSDIEVTLDELKHGKQFGNITFQMPYDEEVIDTIIGTLEKQLSGGWIPVSQMLTKRNKDGYAVPIDCRLEKCRYRHCNDCAYVGTDNIFKIIERLCKYEETGLVFEIMDKED